MIPQSGAKILVGLALVSGPAPLPAGSPGDLSRYRVEQVFRLEVTTAQQRPVPGRLSTEPLTTGVEGRVGFVLEQTLWDRSLNSGAAGELQDPGSSPKEGQASPTTRLAWRFTQIEVDGPVADSGGLMAEGAKTAALFALTWMKQLEGKEFSGSLAALPVLPLGESPPAWLTAWLRFAQSGTFSGTGGSPVELPATEPDYQLHWLRSEFRLEPCHVQQARWVVPVQLAPGSISPELEAEGVEARTYFSATSLEWVAQTNPQLIYAERSGVRETFWDLSKVKKPELQDLVFRLRVALQVRVERLP